MFIWNLSGFPWWTLDMQKDPGAQTHLWEICFCSQNSSSTAIATQIKRPMFIVQATWWKKYLRVSPALGFLPKKTKILCLETKIVLREPWACLWAALPSCWQTHCFGFVSLISSSLSLPMTAWGFSTKVKLQWTLFFLGQKEARVRERWGEGFSWVLRG